MRLLSFFVVAQAAVSVSGRNPLRVSLQSVENTTVKVLLENSGSQPLKLLRWGTLLDFVPTDKFEVYVNNEKAPFKGIYTHISRRDLSEDAFKTLHMKEKVELEVDVADLYDIKEGEVTIRTSGILPLADSATSKLVSEGLSYQSNTLIIKHLKKHREHNLGQRSQSAVISTSCTSAQSTAMRNALASCAKLAQVASVEALNGSAAKFQEYFMTSNPTARKTVSDRFSQVAAECGSSDSRRAYLGCGDSIGYCLFNRTIAYTVLAGGMSFCPSYFALEPLTTTCHGMDQAGALLHEMTHADTVFQPVTQDIGYGFSECMRLTSEQALLNADSHRLYANALFAKC